MPITYDYIDDYLYRIAQPRDKLLQKLEETAETRAIPIIGPLVGRLLYNLARTNRAKNILEIGTAIAYSTIWLGRAAAQEHGTVTTIERDQKRVDEAEKNITEAGLQKVIRVVRGDALEVLARLRDECDLIFLDSDKEIYSAAFKECMRLLKKRGVFVADNVLWGGEVAQAGKSVEARAILQFNQAVLAYHGMSSVILPLRDGVLVGLRE